MSNRLRKADFEKLEKKIKALEEANTRLHEEKADVLEELEKTNDELRLAKTRLTDIKEVLDKTLDKCGVHITGSSPTVHITNGDKKVKEGMNSRIM